MRTIRIAVALVASLAAPLLAVGAFSDGPFANRVFEGGLVMLAGGGLAVLWMWLRRARLDREFDERERVVVGRAATFTCVVISVAIQSYWAMRFAKAGNAGDDFFWVLATFWGALAASYIYNRVRT